MNFILKSPIWGGAGSAPITGISVSASGQTIRIPLHNSYMSMAVASGLIGVALLLTISLFVVWVYVSRSNVSTNPGGIEFAAVLVVLLVTLTVNPVLDSLTGAIGFYAILVMSVLGINSRALELKSP
jgi:O-antigen ligase